MISTQEIIASAPYINGADAFFSKFDKPFDRVCSKILKLETRMLYRQPGNPSYDAFEAGDWDKSLSLIPESHACDEPMYKELNDRGVSMVRCRPVTSPLTDYLRWEFEHYRCIDGLEGETILACDINGAQGLFDSYALHDFMVFDDFIAFVHDYDEAGFIKGGWIINELAGINALKDIYKSIQNICVPYLNFVESSD